VKLPWLNYLQQKRHQRVIDEAVKNFGESGVVSGFAVEQLYREIRPLRIYEGASEVQKLIIASQTLKDN
jgi:acyl-CoA dehydrogenase